MFPKKTNPLTKPGGKAQFGFGSSIQEPQLFLLLSGENDDSPRKKWGDRSDKPTIQQNAQIAF
jgi:hypothetical protein